MTSHTNGEVMATAIKRHDLDCVPDALNASRNGRFEELALPAANAKNLGVIAMKVRGPGILGRRRLRQNRHELSPPLFDEPAGHDRGRWNAASGNARAQRRNRAQFSPLTDQEREHLRQQLNPAREGPQKRLVGHLDGPTANPEMFLA